MTELVDVSVCLSHISRAGMAYSNTEYLIGLEKVILDFSLVTSNQFAEQSCSSCKSICHIKRRTTVSLSESVPSSVAVDYMFHAVTCFQSGTLII